MLPNFFYFLLFRNKILTLCQYFFCFDILFLIIMQTSLKNNVLIRLAEILRQNKTAIAEANLLDIASFPEMDDAVKDRLTLDDKKIEAMVQSLVEVAALDDPEGRILYEFTRTDGLKIENRAVPFGTILIIYESRPDVTIEAAATAFKAGNRILLKGGKESLHTNLLLTRFWRQALTENGADETAVEYLNLTREETQRLINENSRRIDLIIPRGGESLIRFVRENSSVPVIVSGRGNNFLFVDKDCDFDMVVRIVINGKKRISVCNALDKVLIDSNLNEIQKQVRALVDELTAKNIEVWGTDELRRWDERIKATDDEAVLLEEFLAPKIYIAAVSDMDAAVRLINQYSGGHSATIVTNDTEKAASFMRQVDCAAVYHNASTRFTDGGQFGKGAEIAISTQKLHFRGPLGMQELVTNKWFVFGNGQIRE